MILIITNKEDITTDFVVNKLNSLGTHYYRFNTEDFVTNVGINLSINSNKFYLVDYEKNIRIDLNKVKSVYYRRPKLPNLGDELPIAEKQLVLNEITYTLEGLYRVLSNKFWINPVFSIRQAENKIYQLIMAKELSLAIPYSVITTLASEARIFINSNNNCIIKPIKTGLLKDSLNPRVIFTNLLREGHINDIDRVKHCPTYFQNNIEKIADIRVTIVGKKIFAAKINSQDLPDSSIDWRKGNSFQLSYDQYKLPDDIEEKCLILMKKLDLYFGAIDLILDKSGEIHFLEINPNGQWAWIEQRLGYNISGEIVSLLSSDGRSQG